MAIQQAFEKMQAFEEREKEWQKTCVRMKWRYIPPQDVQFGIQNFDELSDANQHKIKLILERSHETGCNFGLTTEGLMSEIRKYDTSVLDHMLSPP
jgi:phenylalanine-4-hydroxylase